MAVILTIGGLFLLKTVNQSAKSIYHYPNLPLMYASVRGSVGEENIFYVSSYSITSPKRKKAVRSEIRIACCME